MFKLSAVVISLSALAAAFSLSSSCQSALTAADSDPATQNCTDLSGLVNILFVPANQSLVTPIGAFVSGFCGAPVCSDAVIQTVANNLTTACASDLQGLGITPDVVTQVAGLVQQFFPLAKEIVCLADSKTHEYCISEVLANVQSFTGQPLTIDNIKNSLPTLVGDASGGGDLNLPTNITCTPCVQAAYIELKNAFPNTVNSTAEISAITAQCGATFEQADATSSEIFVGTGTAALSAKATGAALRPAAAAAAPALVALAAAFVALA